MTGSAQFQKIFLGIVLSMLVSGCVTTAPPKDYSTFRDADPRSIIVIPIVNNSVDVVAPSHLLSTLSWHLAGRGYYVFPVNLVKEIMEEDGMGDAHLAQQTDVTKFNDLFGADTVLYLTIKEWTAQYTVFDTTAIVSLGYELKDARSGEVLWSSDQRHVISSNNGGGGGGIFGLLAKAIVAAIAKAAPNYGQAVGQANMAAFWPEHQGLPAGPYSPNYQKDIDKF